MTQAIQTNPTVTNPTVAKNGFEPRLVAFVCKWCTYAGADLAGTSRMTYPPNVRTLMLPCTGRIGIEFIIRAFLQGADGVIVSGCHPGDCHYTAGNYRARRRWILLHELLDVLGVDLRRLELAWISAAEGAKWVSTIQTFTERIRGLGPYTAMHQLSADRTPAIAPPGANGQLRLSPAPPQTPTASADPALVDAVAQALESGALKAVAGWAKASTLNRPRPTWFTSAQAAREMILPVKSGNLVRLLKKPQLRALLPMGIVARRRELMALNVLVQESNIDPNAIKLFVLADEGRFLGATDLSGAAALLLGEVRHSHEMPLQVGFSEEVSKALDELTAWPPEKRWAFWTAQSAKCQKCYACRGSCPLCTCEQCVMDKNLPQWFPTAADGPGNFAWQIVRAFHLAGRCIGCGACQDACPVGIPLNLLNAAMARAALKHFNHRAGLDPKGVPLQADFRPDDKEEFIL